jgi:hypothetical protein
LYQAYIRRAYIQPNHWICFFSKQFQNTPFLFYANGLVKLLIAVFNFSKAFLTENPAIHKYHFGIGLQK